MASFQLSSNHRILLGTLAGIILGLWFSTHSNLTSTHFGVAAVDLIGGIFIDLLKMILVPLVFSSIVVGIASLSAHNQMHRVWKATLLYSFVTMSLSVAVGITASNLFQPGKGLSFEMFKATTSHYEAVHMTGAEFFTQFLHHLFVNPFAAMATGNIMSVVSFSIILGIALVQGRGRYGNTLELIQSLLDLSLKIIDSIMLIAPVGIMALLAKLIATQSSALLTVLVKFIIIIFGTTIFHGLVILPLLLFLVTGMSPLAFFKGAREALVMAFATSSSSATMPVTFRCAEQYLNVNPSISRFVIPLGAHLNMDGTALYEAAAALFVANLVGIDLGLGQQIIVCLTAMVASIGAPGIPSAGMVTMIMVLQSVGLPIESVALLLPIDRPLDTIRTLVNVEGDMVGCLIVQKIAGK